MNKKKHYLPDTSLLFNLIESIVKTRSLKPHHRSARKYLINFGEDTIIPSIVWAEFCGLWFHNNVALKKYDKWFEDRHSVFGVMCSELKKYNVTVSDDTDISHSDIVNGAATITMQKMPAGLIQSIVSRINNTIQGCQNSISNNPNNTEAMKTLNRNKKMLANGKILDGLDSFIAVFAYEYAKKHKDKEVLVVSDDKFMVDTLKYFSKTKNQLSNYPIPENVSAILTRNLTYQRKIHKQTRFKRL